jgi:hypothetical protein
MLIGPRLHHRLAVFASAVLLPQRGLPYEILTYAYVRHIPKRHNEAECSAYTIDQLMRGIIVRAVWQGLGVCWS